MIGIQQWRAVIGCWYNHTQCSDMSLNPHKMWGTNTGDLLYILIMTIMLIFMLMFLAGDIHPHPGPVSFNNISMCHINARSLTKEGRIDDMYLELCNIHEFDVIGVSETHLDQNVVDNDVKLCNYTILRNDRNRRGGGVALYVHNSITVLRRADLEQSNIEMLWAGIMFKNHKIIICVCYRQPNQSIAEIDTFLNALDNSLSQAAGVSHNKNVVTVLLGDFNDRCTNWTSDHRDSELGLKLVNLFESYSLSQLINAPTRGDNLLDLLATDAPAYFTNVDILDEIGLDHKIIHGSMSIVRPQHKQMSRRIWRYDRGNYDFFNDILLAMNWDDFFSSTNDINLIVQNMTKLLNIIADDCIPHNDIHVRARDKPGMTVAIRGLFRQCKRLHKKWKRTGDAVHHEQFRNKRREAKSAFRASRDKFYNNTASKLTDPNTSAKTFWKITKLVYGTKRVQSIPHLIVGDRLITETAEKAEVFNQYFTEQCKLDPTQNDPLPDFTLLTDNKIETIILTSVEIFNILKHLNVSKAVGPDKISNRILKECAISLSEPLARLFNLSLAQGVFPSCWKIANVIPIFKKESKNNASNYRPISLLSSLSKVLEKAVHYHLYTYLNDHSLLTVKNSGFKQKDSTVNQLLSIVHKLYSGLDNKENACLVFLDISKAFDRVWHEGLLFKLKQLGISGTLLKWLESYLALRKQRVILDGCCSDGSYVEAGVPQGSILGPLLFLVYVNDLVTELECDPHLFADDTSLLDIFTNPLTSSLKINRDLERIYKWGRLRRVKFNPIKTIFQIISNRKNVIYPNLIFDGVVIKRSTEHVHLGLTITSNLSWQRHVDKAILKAIKLLYVMNNIKTKLPRNALCALYKSMLLPVIEYCDVIFDNCTIRAALALENVQRRAALACTGAYKHTSNDCLLLELNWIPLRQRRTNHKLVILYKIIHGLAPSYLTAILPRPRDAGYRLRSFNNTSLPTPSARLSCVRNSFLNSSIKSWNSLDKIIRSSPSYFSFKSKLLKRSKSNSHFNPKLYSRFLGKAAVNHTRMRLGLSALNSQRYKYNMVPSPSCERCGAPQEDPYHIFFVCPAYAVPRQTLAQDLNRILSVDIVQNKKQVEIILLYGSEILDHHTNLILFTTLHDFIYSCGRFS